MALLKSSLAHLRDFDAMLFYDLLPLLEIQSLRT